MRDMASDDNGALCEQWRATEKGTSATATEQSHSSSNRFIQQLTLAKSTDPQQRSTFWLGSLLGLRDIHDGYVACVYVIMAFNKVVCFCIYQTKKSWESLLKLASKLPKHLPAGQESYKQVSVWAGSVRGIISEIDWISFPTCQILTLMVSIHQPYVSIFDELRIRLNYLTNRTFHEFWMSGPRGGVFGFFLIYLFSFAETWCHLNRPTDNET